MFNIFYRNPRLLILTIAVIVVAGLSSYAVLPRLEDPELLPRFATVTTPFPGARTERVESLVTQPLEEHLQEVEEIKEIRSISRSGSSTLIVELQENIKHVGEVWSKVRDKLTDAQAQFPSGTGGPQLKMVNIKAYALIVGLTWTQDRQANHAVLSRLAKELEDQLRAIPGTEQVETFGEPQEEISVEVQPAELAALGLTVDDVSRQLASSDAKVSAGQLRTARGDLLLEVDSELTTLERIAGTPIYYGDGGRFVRLDGIADIHKTVASPPASLAVIDGNPAVALAASVRSDYRLDRWNEDAQQAAAQFSAQLSRGVNLSVVFEQNHYVQSRLNTLLSSLLLGGLAVVAVIFFMMGWRSAIIVGAALPLSVLMVLTGLRVLGIPMHQMSITGLIIALGLLIDNAIVVVDEVKLRLENGQAGAHAVARSVRKLLVPLLGSTLTTALAFAPLALMPGASGEFVGSIAVSVILAISSSFLLAMTVIPALTAMFDRACAGSSRGQPGWWRRGFSNVRLTETYRRTLDYLFRRPALGLVLGLVLPVVGFVAASQLPEQFFPPADRDHFHIELELPPQASMANTLATAEQARSLIMRHPQVKGIHWFLGENAPSFFYNVIYVRQRSPHYAQAIVQLHSRDGALPLIHQLQKELDAALPHARVLVRQLEQGPAPEAPVELRLFGPDVEQLHHLGDQLRSELSAIAEVIHTRADFSDASPKLALAIDEQQARLAGLDHQEISRQLAAATEGALGGSVQEGSEQLPVRVRLPDWQRADLAAIGSLELVSQGPARKPVPLPALADVQLKSATSVITRLNKRRMNEIKGYIRAGVLPSVVLDQLKQRLDETGFQLPPGYHLEFGGESAERDEAIAHLMSSVGVLMILMVATLVLSFRSFRAAGLIGAVGVLSIGLGLGALWVFGFPFGFMAIIGTMGLVGVAINDAIVVLAAVRANPGARRGDPQAVRDVVVRSTRHVLATTLTTIAGFIPLMLAGGGFWPPLAVAIAGGVSGATVLALYFVPSAHVIVTTRTLWTTSTCRAPVARQMAFDLNDSVDGPLPISA